MTIPHPTAIDKKRPGLRAFAFGLVLLGMCVFAWGLRYKLSLYDPPHAISHHMAAAKLLPPGKERDVTRRTGMERSDPILAGALSTLALMLFTFAAPKLWPGFGGWMQRPSPLRRAPAFTRSTPFSVRPPPRRR